MAQTKTGSDLTAFLRAHEPVGAPSRLADGQRVGDWEIVAFLGRGGHGEVYRVRHCALETFAALKLLVRTEESARARFRLEAQLLSRPDQSEAVVRFHAFGTTEDGLLYLVTELLESRPLPQDDAEVADFLVRICAGVSWLHKQGYVHRDIKPGNILFRATGEPVLIDLGLVKPIGHGIAQSAALSIVDGRAVGVGTPGYAAPEQFIAGGEVSPATDIHALGMLANTCFGGNLPPDWSAIIRRATSSIPRQRYADVAAFVSAIRHRHRARRLRRIVGVVFGAVSLILGLASVAWIFKDSWKERLAWMELCEPVKTNLVSRVWVRDVYQDLELSPGVTNRFLVGAATSNRVDAVSGVIVRLDGKRHVFTKPVHLDAGRHYWLIGPGTLDAALAESSNAVVHVAEKAVFLNRTDRPIPEVGVRYVLESGGYLNFMNPVKKLRELTSRDGVVRPGKESPWILRDVEQDPTYLRVQGPEDIKDIYQETHDLIREMMEKDR